MEPQTHLEEQVTDIGDKVKSIGDNVTQILWLIKGNEFNKDDNGMIGKQNDHELRIKWLETLIDRGKWFFIGLSLFAGWGLIDVIQKIFLKQH